MKTAGVRELKAQLSGFLREVQAGETILVTDRGRVVAKLSPPGEGALAMTPEELRYRRLVDRGTLRPASNREDRTWLTPSKKRLPPGTAAALLNADREDR